MLAGGLGDATVLYTGRTGTLARAAEQAEIKMILETIVKLDAAIGGRFDQMNSAARRFRFQP